MDEWEEYLEYALNGDEESSEAGLDSSLQTEEGQSHPGSHPHLPRFPIRRFIKAAKRVSRANKKLIAFERGFISETGLKDREWYRHLGVAPGKWLGRSIFDCMAAWNWSDCESQVMGQQPSQH